VEDVLGDHLHFDRLSGRHVQGVDLPLSLGVPEAPHPLLAGGGHLEGVGRRLDHQEEDPRPPEEEEHDDGERDDGPGHLQQHVGVEAASHLLFAAAAVTHGAIDHRGGDQQAEEGAHRHQEDVERVHLAGHRRGRFGEEREFRLHG
jgi:hypothetical protein